MQTSQREEVTVDEALQKSIGEFGAGQRFICFLVLEYPSTSQQIQLLWFMSSHGSQHKKTYFCSHTRRFQDMTSIMGRAQAGLVMIPAAMQNFSMVFTGIDPVREGWWTCTQELDEACSVVRSQPHPDLCSLPRTSWQWATR